MIDKLLLRKEAKGAKVINHFQPAKCSNKEIKASILYRRSAKPFGFLIQWDVCYGNEKLVTDCKTKSYNLPFKVRGLEGVMKRQVQKRNYKSLPCEVFND